ncbi:PIH1 domain-containing protein 2-like isoform X2 [Stylophora pistillata]|uniref:PIH1 domain-containing protein 2-like isoform X2 n=1 Tax=Stylophora pistillata TaxID=50429 RepID=UPI000C04BB55|nr:PIH1 domain-containing protein 2-like isoform X2 [Stylophora pistillata]
MADQKGSDVLNQADSMWKMLDDLADSDPEAYKRFIDKTLKEGSTYFKPPESCFCICTTLLPKVITRELFVNICSWEQMLAPKSENDPIPVMAGEMQDVKDGQSTYSVVDVIVHPAVTKGVLNSKDRKNLLVHVALDYLENAKQIQVSRKYKNFKMSFKGDPKALRKYLRHGREQALNPTNSEKPGKGVLESPESLLRQLSSITVTENQQDGNVPIDLFERSAEKPKKGLIEEVSSTNTVPQPVTPVTPSYEVLEKDAEDSRPKRIVVKVNLPNITSSSQCQLDVCEISHFKHICVQCSVVHTGT